MKKRILGIKDSAGRSIEAFLKSFGLSVAVAATEAITLSAFLRNILRLDHCFFLIVPAGTVAHQHFGRVVLTGYGHVGRCHPHAGENNR